MPRTLSNYYHRMRDVSNGNETTYDAFASYYDCSDLDRAREVGFYKSLIKQTTCALLELGCGTGTITTNLAITVLRRHGSAARIVGVDESENMLDIARARSSNIEWIQGDVRSPPVEGSFDLVICPYHTLQLIQTNNELIGTFEVVRKLLKPDGLFSFEIYQPNVDYLSSWPTDHVLRSFPDVTGHTLEIHEDGSYDPRKMVLSLHWRVLDPLDRAKPLLARLDLKIRQYFSNEVEGMLRASGLRIFERYGDIDRSPFTAKSKKQVIVCGL